METRAQHGNRVGQTDEYGNPINQTAAHGVPHQATYGHEVKEGIGGKVTGVGHGVGAGGQPHMTHPAEKHGGGGILHRSGSSSSSSSSEDDGMGGRRKKGLKEKIKEKLPGGHKTEDYGQQQPGYGQGTTGTGYGGTTAAGATGVHHEPEKKGMMDKIKEKLPGQHNK